MCFYEQHRFQCGDWKWGHFRQHCNKEYRSGETCGMRLVQTTIPVNEKCKLCNKIDTKKRRLASEVERVDRWKREGGKLSASIDKSNEAIDLLQGEVKQLLDERKRRFDAVGRR